MFLDRSLGDIAVFRFCPSITDVSLYNTQVSGKAHSLRFLLLPVFRNSLRKFLCQGTFRCSRIVHYLKHSISRAATKSQVISKTFLWRPVDTRNLLQIFLWLGDIDVFKNTPALKELYLALTKVTGTFSECSFEDQSFSFLRNSLWNFTRWYLCIRNYTGSTGLQSRTNQSHW